MNLQQPIPRRFVAGMLLMLFAFSIMPKKALHDWMVSHTDGVVAMVKSDADQLSKAGFNCSIQHLVAESPFVDGHQTIDLSFYPVHTIVPTRVLTGVFMPPVASPSLRGPPFFVV